MRSVVMAAVGLAVLGGCAGLLKPSGSAATRWAALEKSRAEKANASLAGEQICKNMPVMGSNFPKKVCSTQAEWDEFDAQMRQSANDFDNQRRTGNVEGQYEREN